MDRLMALFLSLVAALVIILLAPVAQADTLLYVDRLTVHDATGRQIGNAWPTSDDVWLDIGHGHMVVEFRLGSRPVIVRFRPNGFAAVELRFANSGCTGQALIDAYWGHSTAVAGPRSTVYVQSGPWREHTARSTLTDRGVCRNHAAITHAMTPLRTTEVDLADHFVPPFTIRARARGSVPLGTP